MPGSVFGPPSRMASGSPSSSNSVRATPTTEKAAGSWRVAGQGGQGGHELAAGEVARGAEDHERARRRPSFVVDGPRRGGFGAGSTVSPGPAPGCAVGFCASRPRPLLEELVAAELVAQGGDDARREPAVVARLEAGEQRRGDDRRGHGPVDRLLDRPAPFARVLDVALDPLELVGFAERQLGEVEQPRAHDRAVAPQLGDLVQVEAELGAASSRANPSA